MVMKFNTLIRHFREGFKSIYRNGWMSFASFSSILISMLILGIFILLALNLDKIATQYEDQVRIRVYLENNVEQTIKDNLHKQIAGIAEVKKVTFVSKEQNFIDLQTSIEEEDSGWLEGYDAENNPLPDSYIIEVFDTRLVDRVADQIKQVNASFTAPVIYEVKYGQGTVEKLFQITNAIRYIGIIIVAVMALTAVLLISNTIKMTIVARRREISIMKLVGATNSFIRWPFFIEGLMIGLFSSSIAATIVMVGYNSLVSHFKNSLSLFFLELLSVSEVILLTGGVMIGLGVFIGIIGSVMSVRKYLKV